MGFPCNQFGNQEPGTDAEILAFVRQEYGVTFPMFAKIDVNGPGAAPLYDFLRNASSTKEGSEDIAWNFVKFLVDSRGNVVRRYATGVTPAEIEPDLLAHFHELPT